MKSSWLEKARMLMNFNEYTLAVKFNSQYTIIFPPQVYLLFHNFIEPILVSTTVENHEILAVTCGGCRWLQEAPGCPYFPEAIGN